MQIVAFLRASRTGILSMTSKISYVFMVTKKLGIF